MKKGGDVFDEFGIGGPSRVEQPAPTSTVTKDVPTPGGDADFDLSAFQQAVARNIARTPIVQKVNPMKKRVWPIAFGPTPVPPGQTISSVVNPRVYYCCQKLINTGDATGLFMSGLFVGQMAQLPANTNPIPLGAFAPSALNNDMLLDTCQPALAITMQIFNATSATLTFSMTMFGQAIT